MQFKSAGQLVKGNKSYLDFKAALGVWWYKIIIGHTYSKQGKFLPICHSDLKKQNSFKKDSGTAKRLYRYFFNLG